MIYNPDTAIDISPPPDLKRISLILLAKDVRWGLCGERSEEELFLFFFLSFHADARLWDHLPSKGRRYSSFSILTNSLSLDIYLPLAVHCWNCDKQEPKANSKHLQ